MKQEIKTLLDIKLLVNTFYTKVREDDLLQDIFNDKIEDRWAQHLEKMYAFWQTILLEEHTYYGSPFPPHASLAIDRKHFVRWQKIFNETIDELFTGSKATEAKWRAAKMAEMFQMKLEYYKDSSAKPLI